MTTVIPCLWSLLDNASLDVIYASPAIPNDMRSFMMQRSLLDLMHPDEVDLARLDLARFVRSKSLHGSVTRCRLRNLCGYKPASDASCGMSDAHWLVVDVVLYAATDRLLLALFHVDPGSLSTGHSVACGETYFDDVDSNELVRSILDKQPTASTTTQRFLHIFDSRTKTLLLSWPERYHHETSLASLLNHSSTSASCLNSAHQRTPMGADHITIPYGCITFALTHAASPAAQANSVDTFVPQQPLAPLSHNANEPCKFPGLHRALPHLAEEAFFGPAPLNKRHHDSLLFDGDTKPFIPYARRNIHPDLIDPPRQPPQRKRRHSSSPKSHHPPVAQNRCESCGTDSSPEWRKGPSGHKTLCNACGLRYSRSVARKEKMAHQQQQQYRGATRYSAPSSPVSSCSSSSSSSASSSPTSTSGPVPQYNMKPYYDQQQRYDSIFRF